MFRYISLKFTKHAIHQGILKNHQWKLVSYVSCKLPLPRTLRLRNRCTVSDLLQNISNFRISLYWMLLPEVRSPEIIRRLFGERKSESKTTQ